MKFLSEELRVKAIQSWADSKGIVTLYEVAHEEEQDQKVFLKEISTKLLVEANYHPELTLTELYELCGLNRQRGSTALKSLFAEAMVKQHEVVTHRGKGAKGCVLELLENGLEYLRMRGIKRTEPLLNEGGFKHSQVFPRWIENHEKSHGRACKFQQKLGGKEFDIVSSDKNKLIGHEICLTGTPEWNAEQLLIACAVKGVDEVLGWLEDLKFIEQVDDALKKIHGTEDKKKINFKFLGDIFKKEN